MSKSNRLNKLVSLSRQVSHLKESNENKLLKIFQELVMMVICQTNLVINDEK